MMQHEFEALADTKVNRENYERIETVYMYYPGIETKEQIVALYKMGMMAIHDLLPRAEELKKIESEINTLQLRAKQLETRV